MIKYLRILILYLIIYFTFVCISYATVSGDIPHESINPGSFYFPFKRLWEKSKEKLLFSGQSKLAYSQSLVKTRLAELNYIILNKFLSEVETSSQRFAYQAGILTEELVKQNKVNEKENLIKEFEKYSKFLANLRDKYPANSSFWMLIQHDINTLSILSERLK